MLNDLITTEQLEQLDQLIRQSNAIVCVCHQNPDGDALGSMLGWANLLTTVYGKSPEMFAPDQFPDYLMWLPNSDKITRYDKHREGCDWTLQHADLHRPSPQPQRRR